jgi:hypothetical protein
MMTKKRETVELNCRFLETWLVRPLEIDESTRGTGVFPRVVLRSTVPHRVRSYLASTIKK